MIDQSASSKDLSYFKSISDLSKAMGAANPLHPLITLIRHDKLPSESQVRYMVHDFYMISYKSNLNGKLKYGQGYYDFDEGGLIFVAPKQALSLIDGRSECRGYSLFFHPDFLFGHPIANSLSKYGFFSYNINEALHLSEKEKRKIISIFTEIEDELNDTIDDTSQELIVSYLELLLNYSNKFYKRQFITRKAISSPMIERFEDLLSAYFDNEELIMKGLPVVKYFSDHLNVSSDYLSDMLRKLTGLNAQHHIHAKLIEIAKQKLSTTNLTAAEIAYQLGFEHPQSFNRLFKKKTSMTPIAYKQQFHIN